jgi:protein-disulfide isomerase
MVGWAMTSCSTADRGASTAGDDPSKVLATIDDESITMADINETVGDDLAKMDVQYRSNRYQTIDAALENIVRDRLLEAEATARGISENELVAEATSGIDVTDEYIGQWFEENQARLGGRSLEELYPQIRQYLFQQAQARAIDELARRIEGERKVVYMLEPFESGISLEGAPVVGPSNAAVTLVEFSDFECPFCGSFFQTVKEIEENYGDRVRIVFKQFPLTAIHPQAFKAAEASLCAHDQGRFWDMHDLLFAEQDRLDVAALKEKAGRLGLDQEEFDACLNSGRHADAIRADLEEGARLGIEGTPALFVNGVPLPGGAVPYDVVADVIDKELRRTQSR